MNEFPEGIRSVDFVRAIGNLVDNAFECDDDDLVVPTHISTMLNEISAGSYLFVYEYNLEAMRSFSTFVPSGCLYLRGIHNKIGMFGGNVYHDWDWC